MATNENPVIPPSPRWRFRRMQPGEMNIDPIEAEFFSTEALGSLADALVRESVQNSLDARQTGAALTMRFLFSAADTALAAGLQSPYVASIAPHLLANRSGLSSMPDSGEPLSFLAIEDFGTRGLQGDPAQSEDEEIESGPATRNDFFYFWRNVGRSRKHASELGRWGLGKTVFQAASRINAFFGLTVRADDGGRLLLGQSVLKIHKIDGDRYYPYGYFGQFEQDFALPLADRSMLDSFAADFQLARSAEPGLSVLVPFPDPEITPEGVIASLVRHYFIPIIAGDLVVDVVDGRSLQRIDRNTLDRHVPKAAKGRRFDWQRVFDLARWGMALAPTEMVQARAPEPAPAPRWFDDCVTSADLASRRERFERGQRVAFSVPVWVKPVAGDAELSNFDLYLERDDEQESADQHFVRDGITISGVRAPMPKGIRAIVSVRDRPLAQLLGDSENPAHTEWQERSPKFKNKYRHGPFTLRYVKNAPREIARLLTRPASGRDLSLLQKLFSLEIPTEAELARKRSSEESEQGGEGADAEAGGAIVGKGSSFELQKRQGGFRLSGVAGKPVTAKFIVLWVAYDVRRGNAFSHYQPPDFDLNQAPIRIKMTRAVPAECRNNRLVVEIRAADFQVTIDGFDRHRDIRVRVLPMQQRVVQ